MTDSDFPRVTRLDTGLMLRRLARATGIELTDDGACSGGQVGAAYVRWPDGRRSVLTSADTAAAVRRTDAQLHRARAAGVPAPRYELIEELPGAVAVVQELLPGSPPTDVDRRTLDSMLEVNRRCRGLLAGRHEVPALPLHLRADGPGFCLHEPLARYDRRTARLLEMIEEVGDSVPEHLDGDDLVHFDFHPDNVLVDGTGVVVGVVDWVGAIRGDGDFDLFTLRFDLARRAPELGRWLGRVLHDAMPEQVARACWAHMSLRLVDWSIRHQSPADVTSWLEVAEALRP